MHTTHELTSTSFSVEVDGRPASIDDVFEGFDERDRLGVVVRRPCGGTGASTLILAAVTAFYDEQRRRGDDFWIYPDYFLFQVGGGLGDHNMLEIWPSHKELEVPDDAEQLLRAINDRGVTRLLVPDDEPGAPTFERESLASARSRIVSALTYSPTGRVREPDVRVAGGPATESNVDAILEQSGAVPGAERRSIAAARRALVEDGRPVETYRRIGLDEALARLAAPVTPPAASSAAAPR